MRPRKGSENRQWNDSERQRNDRRRTAKDSQRWCGPLFWGVGGHCRLVGTPPPLRLECAQPPSPPAKGPPTPLAVDETVILLHSPLPLAGVSIVMEKERQHNDGLVNG